jgi:cytidylate kinase
VIVTISNLYGAGGLAAAQAAAEALGYEFVDRQLPSTGTGRSLGSKLLAGLELATPEVTVQPAPEMLDDEELRRTQEAVRAFAARGNAVILGRGAGAILGRAAGVLRVFLYAPRDWRVARIAAELSIDAKAAATQVDRIDRGRRAYMHDWYGVEPGAQDVVDLAIDTSVFGISAAAGLIVAAVRARS